MLKPRLQGFIAGILIAILLISTLALASPTIREVFYGVNVTVNGVPQEFADDSQPFISDGRTFLPVRAIAEVLGIDINWNPATQTVYIGEMPEIAAIQTVNPGFLTMATSADFPPFQFRSNAPHAIDGVDGICVAIAAIIAQELGLQLRIVDMEFTDIIPTVQAGQVDIGMAAMTITEERALSVDFTIPYYTDSQVILARAGAAIQSATDLAGLHVGVVHGYTGDWVVSNMEGIGEIVRLNSGAEAFTQLYARNIDAVVIDRIPAKSAVDHFPELTIIEDSDAFPPENFGISIRQGNTDLLNAINAAIEHLIADDWIDGIAAAYILWWQYD